MNARLGLAALIAAAVTTAAVAQTLPEQVPVKRPDGTVVYPSKEGRDPALTPAAREAAARAEERERMRQETQQSAEERIERSRREREAALTNPARQIPPTTLPR
jgi:hypothetical protein